MFAVRINGNVYALCAQHINDYSVLQATYECEVPHGTPCARCEAGDKMMREAAERQIEHQDGEGPTFLHNRLTSYELRSLNWKS